ncbi:GIY-YIG nuclease family protein [bacterium]|nr:GIY-YIG nuclease family protein [bacterium]
MDEKKFYTYLLLTENNTYYCGYTDDIKKRYQKHIEGTGAKYTKANKPVKIAYLESFKSKSEAMKEECRIKNLTRIAKENLVKNFKNLTPNLYLIAQEISSLYI